MASAKESSLLSKLESLDSTPIYSLFSDYLRPFADAKKSAKADATLIRSLAKKFLSFLNESIKIISTRLSDSQNKDQKLIDELFHIYELCLDCLDLISSVLSCKPYSILVCRGKLVHYLAACGKYEDGEREGLRVLEKLRSMKFKGKSSDAEFAEVFLRVVVVIIKCAANGKRNDARLYKEVLGLVEEAGLWLKVLDVYKYEKLHMELVTYLGRCTQSLIEGQMYVTGALVREYCLTTLRQYESSSMKDQIYKFSRRICSSLFTQPKDSHQFVIEVIICVLEFIAHHSEVELDNGGTGFAELVSYCASKCRTMGTTFCAALAGCIEDRRTGFAEVSMSIELILKLYAMALHLGSYVIKYNGVDMTTSSGAKDELGIRVLLGHVNRLHDLSTLLGKLRNCFRVWDSTNYNPYGVEYEDSVSRICLPSDPNHDPVGTGTQRKRQAYMLSYLDVVVDSNHETSGTAIMSKRGACMVPYLSALKFLCEPIAELVVSERKEIISEIEAATSHPQLCIIQDALYQFSDVFLFLHSCTSERDGDGTSNYRTISLVAIAAFTLSIKTSYKMKAVTEDDVVHLQVLIWLIRCPFLFQKSERLIKHIVSSESVQPEVLKSLSTSLLSIGVVLKGNELVKEASKALKLCCKASWNRVVLLCKMFVHKSQRIDDVSEGAVVDSLHEACTRTASVLDVLNRGGSPKKDRLIVEALRNWSAAADLFETLPAPIPLVKQWVKIQFKLFKNIDVGNGAPTLFCLLSSSAKVSKRRVCTILEQELQAYKEMESSGPKFCQKMQMKIMNILVKDVYVTKDAMLKKSRILLRQGRLLRATGAEGLKDCIKVLSEAISIMNAVYDETCGQQSLPCHQLAVAYCLRALCTQEAEPNSKRIIQDMDAALNIWLGINLSGTEGCNIVSGNTMLLLYNMVDLLSLKGCMDLHYHIYKLLIRLLKLKNVSLEKCLAILWESRRLTHARCGSPISDAFIMILSEHCGELAKSINFWIRCLKGSRALEVSFKQSLLFIFSKPPHGCYINESSPQSFITINDVKEAASQLIVEVPQPPVSEPNTIVRVAPRPLFLAGYLYYDLCERLIRNGQMFEALSYAKEAHRLRSLLFQKKFFYSCGKQAEKCDEAGNTIQNLARHLENFEVASLAATELWLSEAISGDMDVCYLSPWNVLQCYLESTLQVGMVHELVGNGNVAETYLQWGKTISSSQNLPQFIASFSSILGKLYCKRQCRDLAVKELRGAKQILAERRSYFSCLKCRLMLEATVDQQLGDICRSHFDINLDIVSGGRLLKNAVKVYNSAIEKLNLSDWKNSISCPKEVGNSSTDSIEYEGSRTFPHSTSNQADKQNSKVEGKKCRKNKNAPKSLFREQHLIPEQCPRITRSRNRSSQNQRVSKSIEAQATLSKHNKGGNMSDVDTISPRELDMETKCCIVPIENEGTCICNKMKCLHCLPLEVIQSGLLDNFVHMQWEFIRRRMLLVVLIGKGKCLSHLDQIHKAHEIMLQGSFLLISRNTLCHTYPFVNQTSSLDLIGKEIPGDCFAVEHAAVLYNICWFALQSRPGKGTRNTCCDVSRIELQKIVCWLKLAFVLCREVPILFQKVSRLLATLYVLSATNKSFSLSFSRKVLSESYWASFFHQASIGTSYNYQFVSNLRERCNTQHFNNREGSSVTASSYTGTETHNLLRIAPDLVQDLEQLVNEFFVGFPCATVICISFLGDAYISLLRELLPHPPEVRAWLLLSRLNSKSEPIVILLPVDEALEDDNEDNGSCSTGDLCKSSGKVWHCPWGSSVADKLTPTFKLILEENYASSCFPLEDTKENRVLYWMQRKKLDQRLCQLLSNLEDSWLGPWKQMLLGELTDCKSLDSVLKKLARDLKSKCNMDANKSLLRVILGGLKHSLEGNECMAQLCSKKGCYIASLGDFDDNMLASQLILEALDELKEEDNLDREPTILVMDSELQMLPWENLPILRDQEVYRMPSFASITAALERIHHHQKQVRKLDAAFPLIDPMDAFYLLNPSGEFSNTQDKFENWFRDQNMEGKAGSAPTSEELAQALKSHDLFLYFGHGSGSQYISSRDVLKLENCAGTLLMGCSSGSLRLDGCYVPCGTPLYYLQAGSPIVIANLWEVTDKDIDRFGKAMLDAWMRERSRLSTAGDQCTSLDEELESITNLRVSKGDNKKKGSRKKLPETQDNDVCNNGCNSRPKLGAFMGKAREACTLPFLIGAAPVCYGVPTGIRMKKVS